MRRQAISHRLRYEMVNRPAARGETGHALTSESGASPPPTLEPSRSSS